MRRRSALHYRPMRLGKDFTFLVEECIRADSQLWLNSVLLITWFIVWCQVSTVSSERGGHCSRNISYFSGVSDCHIKSLWTTFFRVRRRYSTKSWCHAFVWSFTQRFFANLCILLVFYLQHNALFFLVVETLSSDCLHTTTEIHASIIDCVMF